MLQIDHVYEFLHKELFYDFEFWYCKNGVVKTDNVNITDVSVFTPAHPYTKKIFFYDQEPFVPKLHIPYTGMFTWQNNVSLERTISLNERGKIPYGMYINPQQVESFVNDPSTYNKQGILSTSEQSEYLTEFASSNNLMLLYYFFHGFAALDWYRGYYALNHGKEVNKTYEYDYISYNRIIDNDRSYRIYFVSLLKELALLDRGQVSFGVTDYASCWQDETSEPNSKLSEQAKLHIEQHLTGTNKIVLDHASVHGSASADIPRETDAFWHIVTETVFYYNKLHLTEKIFKPIVNKQPFMLLAAPGNLAYLKSYGFKTFEGIIDESYDTIQDNDQRTEAVVKQIAWYCALTAEQKQTVIEAIAPIVEYNFHHFYGEFKHIITRELLDNCRALFKEIGYNDQAIAYDDIFKTLVN